MGSVYVEAAHEKIRRGYFLFPVKLKKLDTIRDKSCYFSRVKFESRNEGDH